MNKQSDKNTQFETGSQRDDRTGKLRMSLIPQKPLKRVMKKYLDGAETYGQNNWVKGQPFSVLYDSAQRHMMEFWEGDTSEDHLAAAAWNILSMMHFEENKNTDLDDRMEYPR